MGNCFFIIFYIFLFFGLGINKEKELVCLYTNRTVIIDAQLNEWEHARFITIRDESRKSGNSAVIMTLWDDQNLYIAFQVKDNNLKAEQTVLDHALLYLDDMVEFLIDSRNDKGFCWDEDDIIYHINLLGQKKDDKGSIDCVTNPKWNGEAEYAINMIGTVNDSTDNDTGYTVEVSISWKELNLKPISDLKMGVNFAIGDSGNLFDWVDASPFRSPYAFGNLILARDQK